MLDTTARVITTEVLPLPYYRTVFAVPREMAAAAPGQFVMIGAPGRLQPYLRRAYSVFDIETKGAETWISVLGKVIGPGTQWLSASRAGDEAKILGPLGQGFRLSVESRAALVAGGVGSAALMLLAEALCERGCPFDFYYGGRGAVDLACSERFAELADTSGGELIVTTEDGTRGEQGLITGPLERGLATHGYDGVFTCGPIGLMAAVTRLSQQAGVPVEAALETVMGCGYGACLGCSIETVDGSFELCCKEGPIFRGERIRWECLAG